MLPGKQYTPSDYASMAWRRRWVIVVPLIVVTYGTLIISSRLPDSFQSEMLIQVVPQRVPDAYVRSTVTMKTIDRLSTLKEQIMSRTELERLIVDMNLYPEERKSLPMQDVVEAMRLEIRVDPVQGARNQDADSFYVRFSYPEAAIAQRVTERLGGLFIDVNARDRGSLAEATKSFLQTQLADAQKRLLEQEDKVRQFREQNSGRLPTQLQYNMTALQNTQMRIQALVESLARDRDQKMMLERLHAEVQATEIAPPPPPPTPPATQAQAQPGGPNQTAGSTKQNLETARQMLVGFELRLRPEHPDVIRTKALIVKLETQLEEETKAAAAAAEAAANDPSLAVAPVSISQQEAARRDRLQQMRAQIESLERQILFKESEEQRIRAASDDLQRRIEQVPGVESEWIALSRDYDTQQAAYKDLLTKAESANLAANLEQRQIGEQFKILDPARTPVRPTGVNRLELNAMGAGIGLALGLALALLLELRDRTFRRADEIVEVFKLPVIALVPHVMSAVDRHRLVVRRRVRSAVATVAVLVGGYGFWAMQLWRHIV